LLLFWFVFVVVPHGMGVPVAVADELGDFGGRNW
jgi:hypothetical protein